MCLRIIDYASTNYFIEILRILSSKREYFFKGEKTNEKTE